MKDVIRGHIGFDGLLLSDDLSMQALGGSLGERAARALAAGCDIALHCNGRMDEMTEIVAQTGPMTEAAGRRFDAGRGFLARHRDPAGKAGLADAAPAARGAPAGMGIRPGQIHVAVCAPTGLNRDCMNEPASPPASDANAVDSFAAAGPDVIAPGEGELIVNLEGFEGPLDLLLTLARDQKVDLRRISMVALVDQYLAHVAQARRLRLELAADYLVMAAWLAYLKSRLLLPEPPAGEEPSGQEMADALQWQLRRLEAMQEAGVRLMARPQLGKDIFARGQPEGVVVVRRAMWDVKLYDLLHAYGEQVRPKDADTYQIEPMQFFSVEEAAERLGRMLGIAIDWQSLEAFLPAGLTDPKRRRSALASTFVAGLQLAKDGQVELRQTERFGPIHLRKRTEQR